MAGSQMSTILHWYCQTLLACLFSSVIWVSTSDVQSSHWSNHSWCRMQWFFFLVFIFLSCESTVPSTCSSSATGKPQLKPMLTCRYSRLFYTLAFLLGPFDESTAQGRIHWHIILRFLCCGYRKYFGWFHTSQPPKENKSRWIMVGCSAMQL